MHAQLAVLDNRLPDRFSTTDEDLNGVSYFFDHIPFLFSVYVCVFFFSLLFLAFFLELTLNEKSVYMTLHSDKHLLWYLSELKWRLFTSCRRMFG